MFIWQRTMFSRPKLYKALKPFGLSNKVSIAWVVTLLPKASWLQAAAAANNSETLCVCVWPSGVRPAKAVPEHGLKSLAIDFAEKIFDYLLEQPSGVMARGHAGVWTLTQIWSPPELFMGPWGPSGQAKQYFNVQQPLRTLLRVTLWTLYRQDRVDTLESIWKAADFGSARSSPAPHYSRDLQWYDFQQMSGIVAPIFIFYDVVYVIMQWYALNR